MSCSRIIVVMAAVWLVAGVAASPARRSPDLEARRRSAVDRSFVRIGRSFPPEQSAADFHEALQRPSRRGNSFLRFGKSQPLTLSTDDLITILKAYEEEFNAPSKKSASFVRFGRDPSFIRFGRSADEDKPGYEQSSELVVSGFPQRKSRARDHFIRLGRDSEEINDVTEGEEGESRKKRSAEPCSDCQS